MIQLIFKIKTFKTFYDISFQKNVISVACLSSDTFKGLLDDTKSVLIIISAKGAKNS